MSIGTDSEGRPGDLPEPQRPDSDHGSIRSDAGDARDEIHGLPGLRDLVKPLVSGSNPTGWDSSRTVVVIKLRRNGQRTNFFRLPGSVHLLRNCTK